ncbi:MAG TPA: hypothetical protein VLH35_03820 [Candidatus Acidoferrales bacterium]|nr:hypothetical protein [Candidatus Acidoferrales bacterium]
MKIPSNRTLGITALVTGAVSLCLLVMPYMLFPQFYIPKANAATGYTAPATVEGWAFMVSGLTLLAVTIVCAKLRKRK